MRIIDRYLIRSFLGPFLYCLILFSVLFVVIDCFNHLDDYVQHDAPIRLIVVYYFYLLPSVLIQIVPIAVLVSILFGLGHLNKHNEITALKAGGVSAFHILSPYIFIGILISFALFLANEIIVPKYMINSTSIMNSLILKGKSNMEERSIKNATLYGKQNRIFFAREMELLTGTLYDVIMLEDNKGQVIKSKLTATKAKYKEGRWIFYEAMRYNMDAKGNVLGDPEFAAEIEMDLPEKPTDFIHESSQIEFMNAKELKAYIHNLQGSSRKLIWKLNVDFHQRIAFPFISLVVILIGAPLAIRTGRGNVMRGIGTSFVVIVLYYGINSICLALGKGQHISPPLAAWFSNLLFALIGC